MDEIILLDACSSFSVLARILQLAYLENFRYVCLISLDPSQIMNAVYLRGSITM